MIPQVRRAWLGAVALILFGAWALRLWRLDTQSLWHDEAWSVFSAYHPLAPMGIRGSDPNAPPLFYMSLGLWQNLAGDAVWTMRYWSLLLGAITVALAIHIGRHWGGHRAGSLAGILVAVSPILWVFSQEIRAYIAMPLLALLMLMLVDLLLKPGKVSRRAWLWLPAVELVALYTHNLSVPLIAWLNVTVLLAWLFTRRSIRQLIAWLAVQAGLFALYLPWLITQRQTGTPLNTPPALTPALFWDIWQSYFTGIKALVGADSTLMALIAIFGGVTLIATGAALIWRPSRRTWLLLSQAILLPVFQLAIIMAAHIDFHPRYFILGVPATLILVAVGAESLFVPIKGLIDKFSLQPAAAGGVAALGAATMACMVNLMYSSPVYQHDDFRAIAERYARLGPDDAIIIPYGWEPTLDYYSHKMNFRAKFIEIPLHSSADVIIDQLRDGLTGVRRAEVLTWYQLPADVRGAYPCLLSRTRYVADSLTVSGLKSEAYDRFSTSELTPINAYWTSPETTADFGQVQLVGAILENSGAPSLCLITRWQLAESTPEDWRISMRVMNGLGWDIAQADSDLLNDDQLPTSFWSTSQIGTVFTLINLPVGIPRTTYPVTVSVYNTAHPGGLDATQNGQGVGKRPRIADVVNGSLDWLDTNKQPVATDVNLGDGVYLRSKQVQPETVQQGQTIRVTLEWVLDAPAFRGDSASVDLLLSGKNWHTRMYDVISREQDHVLWWGEITVPAEASGPATLSAVAPNGKTVTLAEYDIAPIDRQFTEPSIALNARLAPPAEFSGVGQLIGAAVPESPVSAANPLPVTLLWKASATPGTSYTVFIHLRGKDGQIIAQNDAQPVGGKRPTTTWLAGEYLVDQHTLTFNDLGKGYTGPATLVVGLYDASTGKRVLLSDGGELSVLPVMVGVR